MNLRIAAGLVSFLLLSAIAPGQTVKKIEKEFLHPDSKVLVNQAVEKYDNGDVDGCIRLLSGVQRNDSNYFLITYELALGYSENKQYKEAIEKCKEGIATRNYVNRDFYSLLGSCYDYDKNPEMSLKTYAEGAKKFPFHAVFDFESGITLCRQKNFKEGFDKFYSAFRKNALHPGTHLQMANTCRNNDQFVPAVLSYLTFLVFENDTKRSFKVLVSLDELLSGKYTADSAQKLPFNFSYLADNEQILRSKVAVDPKYKTKVKLPYSTFVKQVQLLLEKLPEGGTETDFWSKELIGFYKELWNNGHFEGFMYHIFSGDKDERVLATVRKKKKKVDAFVAWAGDYWRKRRDVMVKEMMGIDKSQELYFYAGGAINAIGNFNQELRQPKGAWKEFYKTGYMELEGFYNDNYKKEGVFKEYYNNGVLHYEITYKDGELNGPYKVFSTDGYLKEEGNYAAGKLNGENKGYYVNGQVRWSCTYKEGKIEGLYTEYSAFGNKSGEYEMKAGEYEGKSTRYYYNGNLEQEFTLVKNQINGTFKKYHLNGMLERECQFADGKGIGLNKEYHANGKLSADGEYGKGGKRSGVWKTYSDKGFVIEEETLSDDEQDGPFKYYDPDDGKLYCEGSYRKGKPVKVIYYNKKGEVVYKDEDRGGDIVLKAYTPHGKLNFEVDFRNGKRNGAFKEYYHHGSLEATSVYVNGQRSGEATYYEQGNTNPLSFFNYKEDKLDGYYRKNHINGSIEQEGFYVDGEREGVWQTFYKNGNLRSQDFYIDDQEEGFQYSFWPNGKLKRTDYATNGFYIYFVYHDTLGVPYDTLSFLNNGKVVLNGITGAIEEKAELKGGYYSGVRESYFANGKLAFTLPYNNGKINGKAVYYYANGIKSSEKHFKNSNLDSLSTYYDQSGKLFLTEYYKEDNLEGKRTYYYENGNKEMESEFKDDEKHGLTVRYGLDGAERGQFMYYKNQLISYRYKKADGSYCDWIMVDKTKQTVTTYYQNGKKSVEFEYNNSSVDVMYRSYHSNGKLHEEEAWANGKRNGKFSEYTPEGVLILELTNLDNNNNGEYKKYYPNGKLKETRFYVEDDLNGTITYYTQDGKVAKTESYMYDTFIK